MPVNNDAVLDTDIINYFSKKMEAEHDFITRAHLFRLKNFLFWVLSGFTEYAAINYVNGNKITHVDDMHTLDTDFSINLLREGKNFRKPIISDLLKLSRLELIHHFSFMLKNDTLVILEKVLNDDNLSLAA